MLLVMMTSCCDKLVFKIVSGINTPGPTRTRKSYAYNRLATVSVSTARLVFFIIESFINAKVGDK